MQQSQPEPRLGTLEDLEKDPTIELDTRSEQVQLRMSTELEWRTLYFRFFLGDEGDKYRKLHEFVKACNDPQCYWEGLAQDHLYCELHMDNSQFKPLKYYIEVKSLKAQEIFKTFITKYAPQDHKPDYQPQYVPEEAYEKPIKQYPAPYYCEGFTKRHHTIYDKEMFQAYNVIPGFSKPVPDIITVRNKLKSLLPILGKVHVVGMLRTFGMESILDIGSDVEMLYYLDSAVDQELKQIP